MVALQHDNYGLYKHISKKKCGREVVLAHAGPSLSALMLEFLKVWGQG